MYARESSSVSNANEPSRMGCGSRYSHSFLPSTTNRIVSPFPMISTRCQTPVRCGAALEARSCLNVSGQYCLESDEPFSSEADEVPSRVVHAEDEVDHPLHELHAEGEMDIVVRHAGTCPRVPLAGQHPIGAILGHLPSRFELPPVDQPVLEIRGVHGLENRCVGRRRPTAHKIQGEQKNQGSGERRRCLFFP